MKSNDLLHNIEDAPKDKKLIIFDLDGTLAESKSVIDDEMAELLIQLLEKKQVAVIGGGRYELFQHQLLSKLPAYSEPLKNLFLFPVTATSFYRYDNNNWGEVYKENFSKEEKESIFLAFEKTFQELDYRHPEKIYGELIEDRGAEIVFSALGQNAPLELKEKWKEENPDIRSRIERVLQKRLPDMEAKVTGLTSIDVTRKGIDKAYGIQQIKKYLEIPLGDMIFVGDDFAHEGNDEAVLRTSVPCFEVKTIEDTKKLISSLTS